MSTPAVSQGLPPEYVYDFDNVFWQRLEPGSLSIPEYIEGNARGTIKRMYGCFYQRGGRPQQPGQRRPG